MQSLPPDKIRSLLPKIDNKELDVELYRQTGLFILREALPLSIIKNWQSAWSDFYASIVAKGRQINPYNAAVVQEPAPSSLAKLYENKGLLDVVEKVHGPDLAFYFQRFLVKDKNNLAPVFLHQDFGYNCGWPDKTMVFVSLNPSNEENGGLTYYPGTHQYGFLGDAGEINQEAFKEKWAGVCPPLEPGDVVLMHPFTWHSSGAYRGGADRAVVQICYQPARDPTSLELVRGKWQTEFFMGDGDVGRLFKRSRTKRLIELQSQLDRANK